MINRLLSFLSCKNPTARGKVVGIENNKDTIKNLVEQGIIDEKIKEKYLDPYHGEIVRASILIEKIMNKRIDERDKKTEIKYKSVIEKVLKENL